MTVRPFQPLQDRLAGKPVDRALYDGVPGWLGPPLSEWLSEVLTDELAQRVGLRLRLQRRRDTDYWHTLVDFNPSELLTIVDAVLQLHPAWEVEPGGEEKASARDRLDDLVFDLDEVLLDASSLYQVDSEGRCLARRIDESVQKAAEQAMLEAPDVAADHLRTAWIMTYGLAPDPDKVLNEAIRAVEEVACPLVEPRRAASGTASLGTVIGELKNSGHVWELVLPGKDGDPRGVDSLVAMLETLWHAQLSRHGGAPKSRRQNQEEAEAGVHLAVLLVQWLTAGVLRRKAAQRSD